MEVLDRFPYKNMKIIAKLVSTDEGSLGRIQTATGLCVFDSTEVSNMLCYLTSFGKVIATEDKWTIQKNEIPFEKGEFRKVFLEDAIKILRNLSDEPASAQEIGEKANLDLQLVEAYLPFLEKITKYGLIIQNPENFGGLWQLASS